MPDQLIWILVLGGLFVFSLLFNILLLLRRG
jgi:hypothetical protein